VSSLVACHPKLAESERRMEAPPGFEPGMEVLQSGSATFRLPLGHKNLAKSLTN
jgi:hypothetical protein